MSFRRFWAIFKARNYEFFRDRSAFGWNFIFPFLLVAGFGVLFGGRGFQEYKVGVFPHEQEKVTVENIRIPEHFGKLRYVKFIGFPSGAEGLEKLKHHKIDFLLKIGDPPHEYWVSDTSPKGYVLEQGRSRACNTRI